VQIGGPGPGRGRKQLYNTLIRAIEQERKLRELEELAARLEELERTIERRKDGNRWPA
jgi:hypothetical protein